MTNILIVAAHPDDEVLGCGGTCADLAARGANVTTCVLCATAGARTGNPGAAQLGRDLAAAQKILGFAPPIMGDFPNIELNVVPHLQLVQFIEEAIGATSAEVIFTHHPSDLNQDHAIISHAAQAAARLFQRREGVPRLRGLYLMEVLSSTDWVLSPGTERFYPNAFHEISDVLERKIDALREYRGVLRGAPHPRSEEIVRALAALRGSQAGLPVAEAFQVAFQDLGHLRG